MLLTLLGEFVLPAGGSAWTQTIVGCLRVLDVEEKNARQALSRLAEQGFVRGSRSGRRVRWHLTPTGVDLLTRGTERIYGFGGGRDEWDGRWLVVVLAAPEDVRPVRHQLRSRLGFLGLGFLGTALALTPHVEREAAVMSVLKDLGLAGGAVVLRAEVGDLSPSDLLPRAWDLAGLSEGYRAFVRAFESRQPVQARAQFVALASLVHAWRRFPFVDPELPGELLVPDWPGRRAKALFDERHARWASGACRFFIDLEADQV